MTSVGKEPEKQDKSPRRRSSMLNIFGGSKKLVARSGQRHVVKKSEPVKGETLLLPPRSSPVSVSTDKFSIDPSVFAAAHSTPYP